MKYPGENALKKAQNGLCSKHHPTTMREERERERDTHTHIQNQTILSIQLFTAFTTHSALLLQV